MFPQPAAEAVKSATFASSFPRCFAYETFLRIDSTVEVHVKVADLLGCGQYGALDSPPKAVALW